MTTMTINRESNLLRGALRANAIFSAACGLVLLLASQTVADFLGVTQTTTLQIGGVLLFVWVAFTAYVSMQQPISRNLTRLIIAGDFLWVLGSVAVLALDPFGLSTAGKWAVAIVADIVLVLAIVQIIGLRRLAK